MGPREVLRASGVTEAHFACLDSWWPDSDALGSIWGSHRQLHIETVHVPHASTLPSTEMRTSHLVHFHSRFPRACRASTAGAGSGGWSTAHALQDHRVLLASIPRRAGGAGGRARGARTVSPEKPNLTHAALLPAATGRRRSSAREGGGMASVSGSSDFAKNCGGQQAMGEQAQGASHLRGRVRPTEFGLALRILV